MKISLGAMLIGLGIALLSLGSEISSLIGPGYMKSIVGLVLIIIVVVRRGITKALGKRQYFGALIFVAAITGGMVIGGFVSVDPAFVMKKSFLFFVISVLMILLAGVSSLGEAEDVLRFWRHYMCFSIVYAAIIVWLGSLYWSMEVGGWLNVLRVGDFDLTQRCYAPFVFGRVPRCSGPFANPNGFAVGIVVSFLWSFYEWVVQEKKSIARLGEIALMLAGLVLSWSRAGILMAALGVLLIYVAYLSHNRRMRLGATGGVIAVSLVLIAMNLSARDPISTLGKVFRTSDGLEKATDRFYTWRNTIDIIGERKVLGYGYGTEKIVLAQQGLDVGAHNGLLGLTLETGIGGVGMAIAFVCLGLARGSGAASRQGRTSPKRLFLIMTILILFENIFEYTLIKFGYIYAFYLYLTFVGQYEVSEGRRKKGQLRGAANAAA